MFGVSKMPVHDAFGLNDGLGMAGVPEALKDYRPSGQIWRSDELGSVMRLHYLLTRYVGLERTVGIGGGRTCRRGDDGIPLASAVFPGSPRTPATRPQLPESLFQTQSWTSDSVELGGSQRGARPKAISAFRAARKPAPLDVSQPVIGEITVTETAASKNCQSCRPRIAPLTG